MKLKKANSFEIFESSSDVSINMDKILKLKRKIETNNPPEIELLVMDQSNLIDLKPKQSLFNAPLANGNPKFAPSSKVVPTPIEKIPRREPE